MIVKCSTESHIINENVLLAFVVANYVSRLFRVVHAKFEKKTLNSHKENFAGIIFDDFLNYQ